MSAYIVTEETMRRCVAAIVDNVAYLHHVAPQLASMAYAPEELGAALFAMNAYAVAQRYPGHNETAPVYVHGRARCDKSTKITALKSLECLRYQCSEGDTVSQPLYLELDAAIGALARQIVHSLPAYKAAPWC